jgi:PAS domain S-box-containing protein
MSDPIRVLIVSEQHADTELVLASLRHAGLDPTRQTVDTEATYVASLVPGLDVILAGTSVPALDPARALDLLRATGLDVPLIVVAPPLSAEHVASLFRDGATDYVSTERLEHLGAVVAKARTARRQREEQRRRALALEAAAAEARRRSDESFRLLFASNPLPMWVYDVQTLYFLEVNDAAVNHYGYTRAEFLRMRSTDIRPPEEAARFEAWVAEVSAEPRQTLRRSAPWPHRLKDGRIRQMDIAGHALEFGGRRAMLVVAMDITELVHAQEALEQRVQARTAELSSANGQLQREIAERRRAEEEASRANRAKSDFLSRMSHELRTPLNGILGFAQLLELDVREREERESIEHILKGGRHLLALIDEILDIARIESGRLHISLEPVLVGDTVRIALDLVRPQATARRVALAGDAHQYGGYVSADRQRFQQVLLNLLSNAVKYNREGGTVIVSCREHAGDRIGIAVRDTGMGIADDKIGRLFTPFDRLGAELGDVEGTGLGLALSKGLVDAMSGRLLVESLVGVGTTFTVELPAAGGPATTGAGIPPPVADAAAPHVQGTVLYIEDNVANLRLFERIMARRPGVTLLSAMQGSQGIELARTHRPRLVILDLHLPDMHGEAVLGRLQDDPLTRDIPVVILSADAIPGDVSRLLGLGARAYLTKPLDVGKLLSLLDDLLTDPS